MPAGNEEYLPLFWGNGLTSKPDDDGDLPDIDECIPDDDGDLPDIDYTIYDICSCGVIYVPEGICCLDHVRIINGENLNNCGGAICITYGCLIADSIIVEGNCANCCGGGIFNSGGCATICDSCISDNCANCCGGAIYAYAGCLIFCGTVCICGNYSTSGVIYLGSNARAVVYGTIYDWDGITNYGTWYCCGSGCICDMTTQTQIEETRKADKTVTRSDSLVDNFVLSDD
ncbi:MAG: hypothetical protein LIO94_07445 [Clostridiales bacterium]|nr:hypothetical protein [Clostridiales bacterium]